MKISSDFFKEEVRNDFVITEEMKKVWAIQLDLLEKVLSVCKKYNLKIFADSGTLLGAIRHEGYIPWDDDIDLIMPREDFLKLCDLSFEFEEPYFFQTEKSDPTSSRGHIQIRNSNTTGILKHEYGKGYKFNQGIFIDILALDKILKNNKKREKFLKKLEKKKKIAMSYRDLLFMTSKPKGLKGIIKCMLHKVVKILNRFLKNKNYFFFNFEKYAQKFNLSDEKYVSELMLNQKRIHLYKEEWYANSIMKKFEMIEIPVPIEYEKILDEMYGDWKSFKKGTSWHGEIIFDTEKSYKSFI